MQKLYPVFKRLASSIVIKEAIERVLIETIKDGDKLRYSINQNAWNYHNYDLVGQKIRYELHLGRTNLNFNNFWHNKRQAE